MTELFTGVHWVRNFFFVPTKTMPRKLSKDYSLRRRSIIGHSITAANDLVLGVSSKNENSKKVPEKTKTGLKTMVCIIWFECCRNFFS